MILIWHSSSLEGVLSELKANTETGLSSHEAAERLEKFGLNQLTAKRKKNVFEKFMDQMKDFMVIILIIAAVISGIITVVEGHNDWIEPIIIIAIVILNGVLGVIQESKAEAALDALKSMAAPSAKTLRNGAVEIINSSELVPGDIVMLEAGDFIPADIRLIESASLRCEESALTGESVPVEKSSGDGIAEIAPLGDRVNMAYSGCSVAYGRAKAVVTDTGMKTEMGKIATLLDNEADEITPLQKKLGQLSKNLGIIALIICAVILVIGIFLPHESSETLTEIIFSAFMTAVSLAVAAIPEGLPAIVTIVLALGVSRMVKKNAIVRRLPAVETLGSASVICTDKTGTLTLNKMTLKEVWTNGETEAVGESLSDRTKNMLLHAVLCCDGSVDIVDGKEQHIGDPTETAIIAAALKYDYRKEELATMLPRMAEIPFDSDRKLMTTVNMVKGEVMSITKGAPDVLINLCKNSDAEKQKALEINKQMAEKALRVIAVATKSIPEIPTHPTSGQLECDMTLLGLVGMIDPPRPEAKQAVAECKSAGIRTVMITGDHIATASAIAGEIGILNEGDKAITGEELNHMSDEELKDRVREYSVYARVSPTDKIRIVKAWQENGEIASMTGDGVNDAPALKAADIGCAMGITGTDVAKGAADMVLTDDNFATIVSAVEQGRGVYDNIRKAVQFLLSCNIGEVLCVFFAMLIWQRAPLAAIQLLTINLVTDGLPALALGVEPPEFDIMKRKPKHKSEGIFAHGVGLTTILQGVMFGAITLAAYWLGDHPIGGGTTDESHAVATTMAFCVLSMSQLLHAFNLRSSHSIFVTSLKKNMMMVAAFFSSLAIILAILFVPVLSDIFGVVRLNKESWIEVIILCLVPLVVVEITKLVTVIIRKSKGQ